MQRIILDTRLARIAELTPKCDVLADIGADHGLLSAYLLQNDIAREVYISDISAPSLQKAIALFNGDPLSARAHFRVGDGLQNVEVRPDVCVIAGRGGETMMGIIERGIDALRGSCLILEPNVDAPGVRAFLYDQGFAITDEDLLTDGRWWYPIIKAAYDPAAPRPDERELEAGPILLRQNHPLLPKYAARQTRILTAARRSLPEGAQRYVELSKQLELWQSLL